MEKLKKNHFTSNFLSVMGFVFGLISILFLFDNHLLFVIFIVLAFLLDVLDGALAKVEEKKNEGWIIDRALDTLLILAVLLKTLFYYGFDLVFPVIAVFSLVNIFIIYQRLGLKRNVEMLHGYHFLYVFYIFTLYKIGLFVLLTSYLINFTLLLMQLSTKRFKNAEENTTWANIISILRPFLAIYGLVQFYQTPVILAVWITIVIILDAVDGIVARKMKAESVGGPMIDIIADRAVELIILFSYAYFGIISYIFPIVFLIRGIATDSIRFLNNIYKDENFKEPLLIGNAHKRFWRATYGLIKLAAFTVILIYPKIGYVFMLIALLMNLYRGLPVIFNNRSKQLIKKFLS